MSALPNPMSRMSEEEYLAFERASEFKHEYIDGKVTDVSGASHIHNLITASTAVALHTQLRERQCKVLMSLMRVKTPSGRYVYPDIVVVCGETRLEDDHRDTLLNPTLIIEILSPSTESYDRGKKFQHYRQLESLQEYVLITQDSPRIERFVRQDDGLWLLGEAVGLEAALQLSTVGCRLALAEVYEQIDFGAENSTPEGS